MNNKIKELEKQCWNHRIGGYLIDGQLHFDSQKFAELIILESCNVLKEFNGQLLAKDATQIIQKHFGVEL